MGLVKSSPVKTTPSEWIHTRGRPIDRLADFFINLHRLIVLQIRQINIQARLQATHDGASWCKQIAIPLAQRITLLCPPLPANFLKRELHQPSSFLLWRKNHFLPSSCILCVISITCLQTTYIPFYHSAQLPLMLT